MRSSLKILGYRDFHKLDEITTKLKEFSQTSFNSGEEFIKNNGFIIFYTPKQKTWIIVSTHCIYCVIDDVETNEVYFMFRLPIEKIKNYTTYDLTFEYQENELNYGVVNFPSIKEKFYFSYYLYPNKERLIEALEEHITQARSTFIIRLTAGQRERNIFLNNNDINSGESQKESHIVITKITIPTFLNLKPMLWAQELQKFKLQLKITCIGNKDSIDSYYDFGTSISPYQEKPIFDLEIRYPFKSTSETKYTNILLKLLTDPTFDNIPDIEIIYEKRPWWK